MPNKIVKGLKVNGRDGVLQRHNSIWEERKSNQLGDANFMEHQLRRVFLWHFFEKRKQQSCSFSVGGPLVKRPLCTGEMPPFSLPQPQQHWAQALMGWHLLYACPRPHWGNEAVSVCCSGRLCVPFITVTEQRHTKREGLGGGSAVQSVLLWLYDNGPHVASTPPWTHTSPSLPFGHRQPLYRLTPAAKICVCAANGGPGRAPN